MRDRSDRRAGWRMRDEQRDPERPGAVGESESRGGHLVCAVRVLRGGRVPQQGRLRGGRRGLQGRQCLHGAITDVFRPGAPDGGGRREMRNRNLILLLSSLLAVFLVYGCAGRGPLTKGETDQFNAISGKIAQAESLGAKTCAPKELAAAKAEQDYARHETIESWENAPPFIAAADKAAETVLAKAKACQPPVANISANPEAISPGQC